MSRFILSLLGLALDDTTQFGTYQQDTLRFATMVERIAGNMGGDLYSSFLDEGREED